MRTKMVMTSVLAVMLLTGCPMFVPPPSYLFSTPIVAKVSFLQDGECQMPIWVKGETAYISVNPDPNTTLRAVIDWDAVPTGGGDWGGDWAFADKITCSVYVVHAREPAFEEEFENFSKASVPVTLDAYGMCTQQEYHFIGDLPTTDISTIPECAKMLEGWQDGEKTYIEECLALIPVTHEVVMQDATSTDSWPDFGSYPIPCK